MTVVVDGNGVVRAKLTPDQTKGHGEEPVGRGAAIAAAEFCGACFG